MLSMGDELSNLVFRRKISSEKTNYSLNFQMIRVLAEMNGTRTLAQVAESLNTPMAELKSTLAQLYRQGLIVEVKSSTETLSPRFIQTAETHLADAIGPIAPKVITDCIHLLGYSRQTVPVTRAKELVERIASKIMIQQKKAAFMSAMLSEFNEL
jgi:predicted transcriptional regulator